MVVVPLLLLSACSSGQLSVSPTNIAWGDVDFQQTLPTEGYDPQTITVVNEGSRDLDITVVGFDTDRLLLGALLVQEQPPVLGTLQPDQTVLLTASVVDYLDGERDTEVTGAFSLDADGLGEPVEITWSFTPIRNIIVDTGQ